MIFYREGLRLRVYSASPAKVSVVEGLGSRDVGVRVYYGGLGI